MSRRAVSGPGAPPGGGFLEWTDGLSGHELAQLIRLMTERELRDCDLDWSEWAHSGQRAPDGDWATWVIMAGRGFGKTLAGARWVEECLRGASIRGSTSPRSGHPPQSGGGALRIALVGATIDEARRVMVEGRSGLLNVAGELIEDWHPSRRLIRFTGGAEATLFSGASPEALRGPEHHLAWCDELAKWEKPKQCWDMLQLGLRLGHPSTGGRPRALVTTTPRPGPVLKGIMAGKGCVTTGGPTAANPHLPGAFLEQAHALYAGTRHGRQELEGELLTDSPGALWTEDLIEACRLSNADESIVFVRTVVGVDPPSGDGTCGIVACALGRDGRGHVLGDHSVTARSPEGWARAVADAAEVHGAQLIVAEANQGGKMVASVLRAASACLRVKLVHAAEGKSARADPVATLFEAGKVILHGRFPELEAQLCGLIAGGGYEGPGASPDRADAMVWALSELMLGKEPREPRIIGF